MSDMLTPEERSHLNIESGQCPLDDAVDRLTSEVERLRRIASEPQCEGCGKFVDPDPTTPDGRGHQVPNEDGSPGFCGPVTCVGRVFACVRECDSEVKVDEDGCCVTCGGDTIPIAGTPCERQQLREIIADLLVGEFNSGQELADAELKHLRARNELLERVAKAAQEFRQAFLVYIDDDDAELPDTGPTLDDALSALNQAASDGGAK